MTRLFIVMLILAVLAIGGIAQQSSSTFAQADTMPEREAQADHPIVGAWRWDNDLEHPDTQISYGVFHADGTYEEVTTGAGTAVGVWETTGARTADVTYVFQDLSEDPSVVEPGATTIRLTADVTSSGTIATATYASAARTLDGTVLDQGSPYDARGTRVTVEPMAPIERPPCDAIGEAAVLLMRFRVSPTGILSGGRGDLPSVRGRPRAT